MVAEVRVRLYPTQDDFVHDARRYTAFIGGRNSGKTYSGSVKAMLRATEGGLGCIAAPNFPMLEHAAKRQFLDRLDECGMEYRKNDQKGELYIPSWNAEVLFVTLESESRVRGPNFEWAWPDEIEYVTDRKIWKALKGAVRAGDNPQIFATSTPKGRRLVWDEWVVGKTAAHALYKATTRDNPFIDAEDYIAGLGYDGVFYDQEIDAEFVTFEGLVYPAFNREVHVKPIDCADWPAVLGVDAGTRNPSAIMTIRHSGDRRHIEREVYRRGMGARDLVAAIESAADAVGASAIYVDPSALDVITDLWADGYPAVKANNNVGDGIREVTSLLAVGPMGPSLTVDPSCLNYIAEAEAYAYPDGGKVETDNPVKANDHTQDGVRYGCMGLSQPPVEVEIW